MNHKEAVKSEVARKDTLARMVGELSRSLQFITSDQQKATVIERMVELTKTVDSFYYAGNDEPPLLHEINTRCRELLIEAGPDPVKIVQCRIAIEELLKEAFTAGQHAISEAVMRRLPERKPDGQQS